MKHSFKLKSTVVAFLALLLFISSAVQAQLTPRTVTIGPHCFGFYEYLPDGYKTNTDNYPVIIYCGGMGERGSGSTADLQKLLGQGTIPGRVVDGSFPKTVTVKGQTFSYVVIAPQFVVSPYPTASDLDGVVNYVLSHYRINTKRVYLSGISLGGGLVENYISTSSTYANKIAAAIPIAGSTAPNTARAQIVRASNLPFWGFHNDGDPSVSVYNTINWVNYINAAPTPTPAAKKTIFHDGSHNAWFEAYWPGYTENGMNVYQWLLQYERGSAPPPPPVNQSPVANAGADQTITLPTSSINLNGTATDVDGTIASYSWSKVSGPAGGSITNAAAAQTSVTGLLQGTYYFALKATDNGGAIGRDTMIVVVNAATTTTNKAPVANAGMDQTITLPTNLVNLSGTATDVDGTIASYAWSKVSGPTGGIITTPGAAKTSVTGLIQGTYLFALQATDNSGAIGKDTMKVVVNGITTTTTLTKYIKVAVYGGADAYPGTDWNNWNVGTAGATNLTSGALKYSDGTASAVTTVLSQSQSIGDNGATYGTANIGNMAPAEVLRHTSYSSTARTLTISGLSTTRKYNVELYASRYSTGNSTIFGVNSSKDTIAVYDNYSTKGLFTNLTPNAQGQIVISIDKVNTYSHLNGFTLTEQGSDYSKVAATQQQSKVMTEQSTATKFDVYPNPIESQFVLQVSNPYSGTFKVQVVNMNGGVQKEYTLSKAAGSTQYYLSASGLSTGTYILKVQMGTTVMTKNVTKL